MTLKLSFLATLLLSSGTAMAEGWDPYTGTMSVPIAGVCYTGPGSTARDRNSAACRSVPKTTVLGVRGSMPDDQCRTIGGDWVWDAGTGVFLCVR